MAKAAKEQSANLDRVRSFFQKQHGAANPIVGHPLEGKGEYVTGLYFDFLCALATYHNADAQAGNELIQRIVAGTGESVPFAEHCRRGMSMTPELAQELVTQCRAEKLGEILFMDSLLIACSCGAPQKEQLGLLAELGDMLGIPAKTMQWLGRVGRTILEQDSEKYQNVIREDDVPSADRARILPELFCYTKPFVDGCLIDTREVLYFYGANRFKGKTMAFFEPYRSDGKIRDRDRVVFERINLAFDEVSSISLDHIENACLKECRFKKIRFYLNSTRTAEVEDSEFQGVGDALHPGGFTDLTISRSKFKDCRTEEKYKYVDARSSLFGSGAGALNLESCEFTDCRGGDYGVLSYGKTVRANNCRFFNCSSYVNGWLFNAGSFSGENNQAKNSVHIH